MNGSTALEGLEPAPGGRGVARDTSGWHVVVAWLAWLCAVVAAVLAFVLGIAERATQTEIVQGTLLTYVTTSVVAIVYASVGLALHRRRAQPVNGWLFLAFGVIAGVANLSWAYTLLAADRGFPPAAVDARDVAWIASIILAPVWLIDATALLMLFPNGKPISDRWGRLLVVAIAVGLLLGACLAVTPGPLVFYWFATNPHPLGGTAAVVASALTPMVMAAMLGVLGAAAWTIRLRYQRSGTIERCQLRWFAWACAVVVAGATVEIVPVGMFQGSAAGEVAWLIFTASALTVPIAALVAIMRYRLYDIDRLISKTFVLGALTAILAGLYAASLRMFTALFVGVTGQNSDASLVLTTLVLATSFTPVKTRLEGIANDRFKPVSVAPPPVEQPPGDLDARMEAIARRVSEEVLAAGGHQEAASSPGKGPSGPS